MSSSVITQQGWEKGIPVSRRSLLAGAVAGATAINLPLPKGSALARYPLPAPSKEVCLVVDQHRSDGIYGSKADAREYYPFRAHSESRLEMRKFVPLDSPARFRVMQIEWDLPAPHKLGLLLTPAAIIVGGYLRSRRQAALPAIHNRP